MKNTGKHREETVNIMSLFQHFGANHPLKCNISSSQRVRLLIQTVFFLCNLWGENHPLHNRRGNKRRQQQLRRLFESVRMEEKHKCWCLLDQDEENTINYTQFRKHEHILTQNQMLFKVWTFFFFKKNPFNLRFLITANVWGGSFGFIDC